MTVAKTGRNAVSSGKNNSGAAMKPERSEVTVSTAHWKMIITIVPVQAYDEDRGELIHYKSGIVEAIWICTDGTSGKCRADSEASAVNGCIASHESIWPAELN